MPLIRKSPPPGGKRPPEAPPFDPAALTTGTTEQRWTAARAAAAQPGGVGLLSAALALEADPRVREAIFTGLTRIASRESAAVLVPYVRSDDAALRTGAIDALSAMSAATAALLPGLLTDPDPDVRLLSCELTRSQPIADANRLLCALLDNEREKNVCAAALEVIAEIGGPEALASVERCAKRFEDDPFLAFSITVARDRLQAQRAGDRE